jgi:hypothetical protein
MHLNDKVNRLLGSPINEMSEMSLKAPVIVAPDHPHLNHIHWDEIGHSRLPSVIEKDLKQHSIDLNQDEVYAFENKNEDAWVVLGRLPNGQYYTAHYASLNGEPIFVDSTTGSYAKATRQFKIYGGLAGKAKPTMAATVASILDVPVAALTGPPDYTSPLEACNDVVYHAKKNKPYMHGKWKKSDERHNRHYFIEHRGYLIQLYFRASTTYGKSGRLRIPSQTRYSKVVQVRASQLDKLSNWEATNILSGTAKGESAASDEKMNAIDLKATYIGQHVFGLDNIYFSY